MCDTPFMLKVRGRRAALLAVLLGGGSAGCATLDTQVVNENYESPPSSALRRARSERAIDHVRTGEDPCADQDQSARPAIESVVHVETRPDVANDDDPAAGCTMRSLNGMLKVVVRGSRAYQVGLVGDREVASIDRDGTIWRRGLLGTAEMAELRCGKLVMLDLTGDRIAARVEPDAVVTTGLFEHSYARPAACSDAQAATGMAALMVIERELADRSEQDAADKQRRQQGQKLRQEQHDRLLRDSQRPFKAR